MISVSSLTPAHARLIAGMHQICFAEPWDEAAMASLLGMRGAFGWLASDRQPQGFALARVAADEAEILTILVLPPFRRLGVAHELLQVTAVTAADLGATRLFLEVAANNPSALALYTKFGFKQVGLRPRYYRNNTDALLLACAL